MSTNVIETQFATGATITPEELAKLLDLVAQAQVTVGVALKHVAPVFARAGQLASLPAGTRIGALPPVPAPLPAGQQLELPLLAPKRPRGRPRKPLVVGSIPGVAVGP